MKVFSHVFRRAGHSGTHLEEYPKSSKIHGYTQAHIVHYVKTFRENTFKHGSKSKSYKGSKRRFNNSLL